jgi:hypothetical protein
LTKPRTFSPLAILFEFLFGAVLLTGSIVAAFCQLNTESLNWDTLLLLLALLIAPLSLWSTVRSVRKKRFTVKTGIVYYGTILIVSYGIFWTTLRILVPPEIKYEVSYPADGATGTYDIVQFYFKHDGRWLEGPSAEGWPMTFSFPDLNKDGHHDIRIVQNGTNRSVEFVYLPQNDGHTFWRILKNDSDLSANP